MVYRNIKPQTADNARYAMCEPNVDNCGAGCTQAVQYFKQAGRWSEPFNSKGGCNGEVGDKIFFKKSNGAFYHTGIVVDWDKKGLYVVEGNTNGGKVAKKFYSYSDSKIGGFGHPRYTKWEETTEEKPKEEVKPTPSKESAKPLKSIEEYAKEVIAGKWGNNPERAKKMKAAGIDYDAVQNKVNEILGYSKSSAKSMTVYKINSWLNVRNAPNGKIIGKLYNGDKVSVYETKDGWARIGDNRWVSTDYLH